MNGTAADKPTLSYADLADLLEVHFGVRPALVTLRAAAQRQKDTTTSIASGIPKPLPDGQGFDPEAVQVWITNHPWHARNAAYERLSRTSKTDPTQRQNAVDEARAIGLSWAAIARAISAADGSTLTRQGAQQRHG